MRVVLISPYQIADGVARYTAELVSMLKMDYSSLSVQVIPWNYPSKLGRLVLPIFTAGEVASRLARTDLVHIQFVASWYLCHLFLPLWLARLNNPKLKIIFTLHETNDNTVAPWLFNWLQRVYLEASDGIIVHSKYHKNLLPARFRKRVVVIPLGVPRIEADHEQEDLNLILLPGFINPWKGYDLVIRALDLLKSTHPKLNLVILGQAHHQGYAERLRSLARSLGLNNRVKFKTQFVPDQEFQRYFQTAGTVVLPYRRIAMSAVLAQAIAHGKVTVMSDLAPFREYTKSEGIYFKNGDYQDLADKLSQAISNSVVRGHQKNLFARLGREYSQREVAHRTFNFCHKIYAS